MTLYFVVDTSVKHIYKLDGIQLRRKQQGRFMVQFTTITKGEVK